MNETPDHAARNDESSVETTTRGPQPGLSGGEYPDADEETEAMSEDLTPQGEDTTFGGALGSQGPLGTMGTIESGIAGPDTGRDA